MPIVKVQQKPTQAWCVWKIEETEDELLQRFPLIECIPSSITHPYKRIEFASVRAALIELLAGIGEVYEGIIKDEHGKPYLKNNRWHVSLTHSFPYVAVIVDFEKPTGIDLEQAKDSLLRVGPRILNDRELSDAADNIQKHCVYWCAKETLIKLYGKRDILLKTELSVGPFNLDNNEGVIKGVILREDIKTYSLHYFIEKEYILVFNE